MRIDFAREIALKVLYKVEEENGYSNLVLDEYLNIKREKLTNKDINLISEIVYGTVSWKRSIDTIIQKYSKIKLNKISKWVKIILRIGVYQIIFLDKIPKSAAVNESVNLCKKYGHKSVSFVNAILRKVEKTDYEELNQIEDDIDRISKFYSMPNWIVEKLVNQYGVQKAEQICKNSNLKPKITIRPNYLKTTKEELQEQLNRKEIMWEEAKIFPFLYLKNVKNISSIELFKKGFFTIQDEGAGYISQVLNPKKGQTVLDACSAPGGKTTYLAELMQNEGCIMAWDLYPHRIKLVQENAKRLGIHIIKAQQKDALVYEEKYYQMFDKILLDVPCMGLGVLKRKPDIKWKKEPSDILEIQQLQQNLVKTCCQYLKIGGELVYSTCSILKEENEDIVDKVITKINKDETTSLWKVIKQINILPDENTDGFFICKIKRTIKD